MNSYRKWLAVVPVAALVLTACGGSDEPVDETEPTEEPVEEAEEPEEEIEEEPEGDAEEEEEAAPVRADADLVIWADDTRAPVITPFAEAFGEEQGITVAVQEVPFDTIRDNVSIQGPAGQGPDVFIGAHDWLGQLVSDGVVAPLDLAGASGDYLDVALQAFAFDGTNYGLPYSIENIGLVRNTELAPETPETIEDMIEMGLASVEAGDADIPVGWQQNDPFHNYWVVTGAGGYVFGQQDDGSYIADDIGIDSDGGLRAAGLFGDMYDQGFVNPDVTYDVMIDSFSSGRTPFAVTGPWALAEFTDVDYVVEPFPSVDGNAPGPFVGVQGFMVSSFAENELAARTFVLDFMGTEDAQLELFEAGGRPPALSSAYEQVQDDPVVAGFGAAGEDGRPMPAISEMGSVWEAWTNAYTNINSGNDPDAAFQEAADQIRALIGT
jgi:arabinogalactan oligomer / maltooligosaccharide transport system substrate-binding protein